MFLYFIDKNGILFTEEGKLIDDHTLVALTIMIAESRPEEKEMMISVIMNCLKQSNCTYFKRIEFDTFKEDSESNDVAHDVAHNVAQTLAEIIVEEIQKNNKVTREQIAGIANVSKKTVERELKKMNNVRYVGSGSNGHWEIIDKH